MLSWGAQFTRSFVAHTIAAPLRPSGHLSDFICSTLKVWPGVTTSLSVGQSNRSGHRRQAMQCVSMKLERIYLGQQQGAVVVVRVRGGW